jgi:hypothetical protein
MDIVLVVAAVKLTFVVNDKFTPCQSADPVFPTNFTTWVVLVPGPASRVTVGAGPLANGAPFIPPDSKPCESPCEYPNEKVIKKKSIKNFFIIICF